MLRLPQLALPDRLAPDRLAGLATHPLVGASAGLAGRLARGVGGTVATSARVTRSFAQVTLALGQLVAPDGPVRRPGGYADMVDRAIGDAGYVEQLARLLVEDEGPARLIARLDALLAPDRPAGRMLEEGGTLDHLLSEDGPLLPMLREGGSLERLVTPGGSLDRLLAPGGPLDQVVADDGLLERLLRPGGPVDLLTRDDGFLLQLLQPDGAVARLLHDDELLERLLGRGGTLDQLAELGRTLDDIRPRLVEIAALIPSLEATVDELHRAVGPIGSLAGRIPGRSRRSAETGS